MASNTRLAVKLFSPIVIIFVLTSIVLVAYFSSAVRENAEASALPAAISTVQQYKTIRGYYTKNVVQKVLKGSDMKPHFNHKNNADQIPLPATFIHDLSEEFSKQDVSLKLYSQFPFPNRADRQLDAFAQEAWGALNQNPEQTFSRVEAVDGREVVRVAVADTMVAQGCVNCHNAHPDTPRKGWKLGDVRGVLEVQIPIDEQIAAGDALNAKLSIFLIIALVMTLLVLAVIFQRMVVQRLAKLSAALSDIADGDGNLGQRLDKQSDDEIGAITDAFNRFVGQLDSSLSGIGERMGRLVATTEALSEVTVRTRQGADRQQQETDQVAAAMNEMTATAQEVASLAASTSEHARATQTDAESATHVVQANMQSVQQLSSEMKEAAEVVALLDTNSQDIGGVLDVIRGIAEQTNLLALNAAIEAARAGEQGRGFAVVADEVRTLASRTQASTEEIQHVIEQLQDGAKNAVSTIEQGNHCLEQSLSQASETHDAIEKIASSINNIRSLNEQIATAAEEQTSVSDEINRNLTSIADVASESFHDSQQIADSVDEISATTESVSEQINRFTS